MKDKIIKIILSVLGILLTFTMILLSAAILWMYAIWGRNLTINDFLFQVGTLDGTGSEMVVKFIVFALIPSVLLTAGLIFLIYFLKKKDIYEPFMGRIVIGASALVFWCVLIFAVKWLKVDDYFGFAGFRASAEAAYVPPEIVTIVPVQTVQTGTGENEEPGEWDYLQTFLASEMTPWEKNDSRDFVESYYIDPSTVDLVFPEKKRNLIFIYLESMEMTFADKDIGGAFDENVIRNLTLLSQENENFSGSYGPGSLLDGGYSYNGGTWTMGAIFSSTAGLPLQTGGIERNEMNTQESFYPSITTLGDILEEEEYRQIFLIGSSAVFGGRKLYFQNHGDFEFRDLIWAKQSGHLPGGYYVWWGYEDQKLFEYARETLTELGEGDQPFNLTMLTVDTHMVGGYTCELCGDEFENSYSNVYACSDKQVSEFIDWIKQQDFYENTTIILMGDHPTMDGMYCRNIDPSYVRRVYTCIINAPVTPVRDAYRSYSTLDMLPTALTAIGVEIPGGRLGLGTSLYTNQRTLTEELGYSAVSTSLSRYSSFLAELASIVPVDEFGNPMIMNEDGSITTQYPDGSTSTLYPDGSQANLYIDGSQLLIGADGVVTYVYPDGTATNEIPAGLLPTGETVQETVIP